MPVTIKVLSWNIFKFGEHLTKNTTRLNVVLDLVNPAAGPAFDLFVVIEPQIKKGKTDALADGSGPKGMIALRSALQARTNGSTWEAVPPIVLTAGTTREAMAVFYNSATLKLTGPEDDAAITSTSWRTAATKGAGPGTLRGKVKFKDAANTTDVVFPTGGERRPYLVTFQTVTGGEAFSILAAHSPSPDYKGSTASARNKTARQGTQKLGAIYELQTAQRTAPAIVVGDFNCCHPGHVSAAPYGCQGAGAVDQDGQGRNGLTGVGFTSRVDASTSLKTVGTATATNYALHAYDYLLTAADGAATKTVTVANARVLGVGDLVTGFSTALNKTKFKPIYKRVRTSAGKGVSDHLPIAADVTIA